MGKVFEIVSKIFQGSWLSYDLKIIFCCKVLRPHTYVVTVTATGLLADSLLFRLIDFSSKERLRYVNYLF